MTTTGTELPTMGRLFVGSYQAVKGRGIGGTGSSQSSKFIYASCGFSSKDSSASCDMSSASHVDVLCGMWNV